MSFLLIANLWWYLLVVPCVFFAWAVIHELSHWLAIRPYGASNVQFTLWPHKWQGHWYWARVRYQLDRRPGKLDGVQIALAPRIADAIAMVVLVAWWDLFEEHVPGGWLWVSFLLGGFVDAVVGSLGIGVNSDLAVAAEAAGASRWELRIVHWVVIAFLLGLLALQIVR